MFEIEYDETKRGRILEERGLDIADAARVFAGEYLEIEDDRRDYGESRFRVWGYLDELRISLVWTPRNGLRRIITMRRAHEQEFENLRRTME